MKIILKGSEKELAAFVLEIQKRQDDEEVEVDTNDLVDSIHDTLAELARLPEKHQPPDLPEEHEPV